MTANTNPLSDEHYAVVEETMKRFKYGKHGLIEVLLTAQEAFGHLDRELLIYVAEKLHMPLIKVYGVATFYDMFTLEEADETECRVCVGPVCAVHGAQDVLEEVRREASIEGHKSIKEVSCLGLCDQAPAAFVDQTAQVHLAPELVPAMLRKEAELPRIQVSGDPRILTGPIGRLDPTDLHSHEAEGAFAALEKALHEMTPEDVIAEVTESRLAGRGGARFPTGVKWEYTRQAASNTKYVVCNFDESEPGTFKDRALMEGNPFRVLEGLILSGYATGARSGNVFIRGEYPAASAVVEHALDEMYAAGLLGDHIMDSDYSFDVEVRHSAGAYICGEETALFEAIEGRRGHPRRKPPYPTQQGLYGKPTAINNVETLAVVPSLVLHGGEWFHQWGTPESVGLKLFCLSGHVNQPGVVEAPLGLTIRDMIERFGGGFDGEPQAVLVGGAAGGFIHPGQFDTPLTHENLSALNVPLGSGALMVFNQSVDLWEVLEHLAHFFVHETCGQCAPCRLGTKQIYTILQRINLAQGEFGDRRKLEKLGQTIRSTCACGLGLTAANPMLTYLDAFDPVY